MNDEEKRVLYGLYYDREMIDEMILLRSGEILWLAATPIPHGKNWRNKKGEYQSVDKKSDNYFAQIAQTSAAAQRHLRYLRARGYINYKIEGDWFHVSVTDSGADIARKLDTKIGRADLWYKDHRDGILWFFVTIAISAITAILVSIATKK